MALVVEKIKYQCNKCHRSMAGTTAYDGACECGGLIEAVPVGWPEKFVVGGRRGKYTPRECAIVTTSEWPIAIIGDYFTVEELQEMFPNGYEGETFASTDLIWVRPKRYTEVEIERDDMQDYIELHEDVAGKPYGVAYEIIEASKKPVGVFYKGTGIWFA